jgi:hypothetical protein
LGEIDLPNLFVGKDKEIYLSEKQYNEVMKKAKVDADIGSILAKC